MQPMQYLCTSTSTNKKTGNVPQIWIGATRDESIRSCQTVACPLLHEKYGGEASKSDPMCYAQHGTPAFAHSGMVKSHERGKDYSLTTALLHASRAARMVRLGAIGDPAALSPTDGSDIRRIVKKTGMALVGYTHGWTLKRARHWRGYIMASCDTMAEADRAIADGWRAAVVLPMDHAGHKFTTPAGHKGVVCPAILNPEIKTCNNCLLCDASKPGPVIGFPDHGPTTQGR